jgi:hypothetical protein
MAVEDHPIYPKWRTALERALEAKEALDGLRHLPETDGVRQAAEADLAAARIALRGIADEIDND